MLTAALKAALIAQLDAEITTNGNREITGAILNDFLNEFLAAIDYTLVSGPTAPTAEPERRFWRSTVDNQLYFKQASLPGQPFIPIRKHFFLKDFGVIGDGVNDESVAIQLAIDHVSAQGSGVLYAEPGTFKCNVLLKTGVTICGSGAASVFRPATDQPVFKTAANAVISDCGLEALVIYGNTAHTTSGYGVYLGPSVSGAKTSNVRLRNLEVHSCGLAGVAAVTSLAGGVLNVVMENVSVHDCLGEGLLLRGGVFGFTAAGCDFSSNGNPDNCLVSDYSAQRPSLLNFLACTFKGINSGAVGFAVYGANSAVFMSCKFYDAGSMVHIDSAENRNIRLSHCSFLSVFSSVRMVLVSACESAAITDCYFRTTGSVSYFIDQDTSIAAVKSVFLARNVFEGVYTAPTHLNHTQEIAGGVAVVYRDYLVLEPEGLASSDVLETLEGPDGAQPWMPGKTINIQIGDNSRPVTFQHGTGNLIVIGGADYTATLTESVVRAVYNGAEWVIFPPAASGDKHYHHAQTVPASVWTIAHNLGKFAVPTVFDSAGTQVEGEVYHVDQNTLTISFFVSGNPVSFAGDAYLN